MNSESTNLGLQVYMQNLFPWSYSWLEASPGPVFKQAQSLPPFSYPHFHSGPAPLCDFGEVIHLLWAQVLPAVRGRWQIGGGVLSVSPAQ